VDGSRATVRSRHHPAVGWAAYHGHFGLLQGRQHVHSRRRFHGSTQPVCDRPLPTVLATALHTDAHPGSFQVWDERVLFVIMISPRAPTKPSTRKPTRLTMMRQHRARLPQSLHTRAHPLPSVVLVSVCMHPCDLSKGPRALSAGDALPAFLLLLSFAASRQISARISGAHRFNLFKLRYYTSDRLPSLHRTVVCRLKKETIRGPRVPSI
jgi:hypothetical protein